MAAGSKATVAAAIKALLDGTGVYVATYLDDPQTFNSASPVAIVEPYQIASERHAAGSGIIAEKTTWQITSLIDRTQLSYDVAVQQLYTVMDTLLPLFQAHVQLNMAGGTVLVATLQNQMSLPGWQKREGTLYRTWPLRLSVEERYGLAITS